MFIDKQEAMREESVFPCGVVLWLALFHLMYEVADERGSSVCQFE